VKSWRWCRPVGDPSTACTSADSGFSKLAFGILLVIDSYSKYLSYSFIHGFIVLLNTLVLVSTLN
jgi:hypothetical protein